MCMYCYLFIETKKSFQNFYKKFKEDNVPVLALGSFGNPNGGIIFDYKGHGSIKALYLRCGTIVDSIEVTFEDEAYMYSQKAGVGGRHHNKVIFIMRWNHTSKHRNLFIQLWHTKL